MDSEKDEKPRNSADVAEEEGLRDLFGSSSDDDSSHKLEESQVVTRVRVLDPEVVAAIEDAKVDSDEDEEERAVKPVGPPLVLKAPIIQKPDKTTLKLVKMSNFVTVEPTPFNAADYQKVGSMPVFLKQEFVQVCFHLPQGMRLNYWEKKRKDTPCSHRGLLR